MEVTRDDRSEARSISHDMIASHFEISQQSESTNSPITAGSLSFTKPHHDRCDHSKRSKAITCYVPVICLPHATPTE